MTNCKLTSRLVWRGLIGFLLAGLLAACGGGGQRDFEGSASSSSGGATSGSLTLILADPGSAIAKYQISSLTQSVARAMVTDDYGNPIPNQLVAFAVIQGAGVSFSPAETAMTDSNGIATVGVSPATPTMQGAFSIEASADLNGTAISAKTSASISTPAISLGAMTFGVSPLSAYGTTAVSVPVVMPANAVNVRVRFTSVCASASQSRALITQDVPVIGSTATATYTDQGCGANDLVTASVEGTSAVSNGTLVVQAPAVANIQFLSASPERILTQSVNMAPDTSIVRFKVVDQNGNPVVAPTNVALALSNATDGITIDGQADPLVKSTDANGEVSVNLRSGNLPTPVSVRASILNGAVSSSSGTITITTGKPIQSKFWVSASVLNIEGWRVAGVRSTIDVIAADNFGTGVTDGTKVNFIGDLVGAFCATGPSANGVQGTCSVDYVSQGERPADGRVTIVAYANGQESFTDSNGNGRYDLGEPFRDLGYVFHDMDEDGGWDAGELIIPYADQRQSCGSGSDLVHRPDPARPNLLFRSDLSATSTTGACDGVWGDAHVRREVVITLSDPDPIFKQTRFPPFNGISDIASTYQLGSSCTAVINFWLQDFHGNPLPFGTSVELDTSLAQNLKVFPTGDSVPNTNAAGGSWHSFEVSGLDDANACVGSGRVTIRTKSPAGITGTFRIQIGT